MGTARPPPATRMPGARAPPRRSLVARAWCRAHPRKERRRARRGAVLGTLATRARLVHAPLGGSPLRGVLQRRGRGA
eukprot:4517019-Alexandrium_andersonii.AAC.1